MRITLDLDDDIVAAADELAVEQGRSLGSMISELVRRGIATASIKAKGDLPVIHVPAGTRRPLSRFGPRLRTNDAPFDKLRHMLGEQSNLKR